jgi:hypothetical protein
MLVLASLRSEKWTACPELLDEFVGKRRQASPYPGVHLELDGVHAFRLPLLLFRFQRPDASASPVTPPA